MTRNQNENLFAAVVKQALSTGTPVEIDGLGMFVVKDGGVRFVADVAPRVFIAYVVEERVFALRLANALQAAGMKPWIDCRKLKPGQNWPRAIHRAIETSDFFVPCLSAAALRKRGQFPYELRTAIHYADRMPLDQTFIAPVRLDACNLPETFPTNIQYVDLFPDFDEGAKRLIDSLWNEFARRVA